MSERQPVFEINDDFIALDEISELILSADDETPASEQPGNMPQAVRLVSGGVLPLAPAHAVRLIEFIRAHDR